MPFSSYIKRKLYWLKDFTHGQPMWKNYKEILRIYNEPIQGAIIRDNYLSKMLEFAKKNTVFYSRIQGDQLSDFPVINKNIIIEHTSDFCVPIEKIPGQVGTVHVQSTSGSTGVPFHIRQCTRSRVRRIATLKVGRSMIGYKSYDLMLLLRSLKRHYSYSDDIIWNKKENVIYADNANLDSDKIKRIIECINSNNVKIVKGYMTSLDTITSYAVANNLEFPNHPFFVSVGELMAESLRLRVINDLKCHIISQYAIEESGLFGQTEIDGVGTDIILNRANVVVEILKLYADVPADKDELGRIVITDFTNYAQPLIRYDTGDLGKIGKQGTTGEIYTIKGLSGRKTDLIFKTDGTPVDFFNSISKEVAFNSHINQWQFIQHNTSEYTMKLCVTKDFGDEEAENIRKQVIGLLGADANVNILVADELPVLSSGKRKIIIQEQKL